MYSITEGYLPLTGGTLTGALTVNDQTTAAQFNDPLNGNANTATALQTSRTINGTSFDGSANITTNSWGISRAVTIESIACEFKVNGANKTLTFRREDKDGTWSCSTTSL